MTSSQRTYGRKRKDEAEEKFDALFSAETIKKPITIEIGAIKRAKKSYPAAIISSSIKNGSKNSVNVKSTIAVKKAYTMKSKDVTFSDSISYSPQKVMNSSKSVANNQNKFGIANVKSPLAKSTTVHSYNSVSNTKYDMLFKKNEKNASDKFDALFGEELGKSTTVLPLVSPKKPSQHPEYDNLFGFADTSETTKDPSFATQSTIMLSPDKLSPTSPTKLPGIARASMTRVGGKVVLNIQKRTKKVAPESNANKNNEIPIKRDVYPTNFDRKIISVNSTKRLFPKVSKPAGTAISNMDTRFKDAPIAMVSVKSAPCHTPTKASSTQLISTHARHTTTTKRTHSPVKLTNNSKPSYNSRPWMQDSEEKVSSSEKDSLSSSQPDSYSFGSESEEPTPKLVRSVTWPDRVGESIVTSLKCEKSAKAYFTVVKHVKNYQNCLEEGEAKEFEDEVSYLLEGLQASQPLPVRCLSVTNLASKCEQHNFRLYLRAHNVADKVFSYLEDAKDNPALALSTAALLFMLSRDRQMEINKPTLQLLLRLLDPFDKGDLNANAEKSSSNKKEKGGESKYKFFKSKGKTDPEEESLKAKSESLIKIKQMIATSGDHLLSEADVTVGGGNLDCFSCCINFLRKRDETQLNQVKRLTSEALLRFTARRTVDWFREEVRLKGGLDHVISLVKSNVDILEAMSKEKQQHEEDNFKPKTTLCILERLLKVLENGIVNSPRNAMYLVTHQRALLLKKLARMMKLCKSWLLGFAVTSSQKKSEDCVPPTPTLDVYSILENSVIQIIKLLVNISNDNEWVSSRVGEQDGMLENIVDCVLTTSTLLKEERRYELILLSLSLLVNLVESSAKNRIALMKMKVISDSSSQDAAVHALIKLFEQREAAARENEVLGEVGVKKAVQAKKTSCSSGANSLQKSDGRDNDGRWVETEDGMEWVPAEDPEDVISGSQESVRSVASSKNPESTLTAEERNEMKETLDKANEHMEDSIVASYAALVLGCLIHGNRANASIIKSYFTEEKGFSLMVRMLRKFLSFMSLTAGMSSKGEKTLNQIIETLDEENNML